jgi:hypothetical protein
MNNNSKEGGHLGYMVSNITWNFGVTSVNNERGPCTSTERAEFSSQIKIRDSKTRNKGNRVRSTERVLLGG